jgi:periplasmic protein TonB
MRPRRSTLFSPELQSAPWLSRIRENLLELHTPSPLSPISANGAPIHLVHPEKTSRSRSAQTASFFTHAAIIAAILLTATQGTRLVQGIRQPSGPLIFTQTTPAHIATKPSIGGNTGGGEQNPIPATHGFFPPHSPIPLAPPRLPDQATHVLSVPSAVLDNEAPLVVVTISQIGIPSMPDDTSSAGPGHHHGIGAGDNGGVGNHDGPGAGQGDQPGSGIQAIALPTCIYCPYPVYTDEARHVKMQGTVTLSVLVGADGRASDIRILRGVGYGLDERAVQTIRGWKFSPARDAYHHATQAWITVEAVFHLF